MMASKKTVLAVVVLCAVSPCIALQAVGSERTIDLPVPEPEQWFAFKRGAHGPDDIAVNIAFRAPALAGTATVGGSDAAELLDLLDRRCDDHGGIWVCERTGDSIGLSVDLLTSWRPAFSRAECIGCTTVRTNTPAGVSRFHFNHVRREIDLSVAIPTLTREQPGRDLISVLAGKAFRDGGIAFSEESVDDGDAACCCWSRESRAKAHQGDPWCEGPGDSCTIIDVFCCSPCDTSTCSNCTGAGGIQVDGQLGFP